ncbi:MAG: hypothetical protein AB1422_04430 [bacterium]
MVIYRRDAEEQRRHRNKLDNRKDYWCRHRNIYDLLTECSAGKPDWLICVLSIDFSLVRGELGVCFSLRLCVSAVNSYNFLLTTLFNDVIIAIVEE